MRVAHLWPPTLKRYAEALNEGWKGDVIQSVDGDASITVAQVHGIEGETLVIGGPSTAITVVLVHRPEEFLLRYGEEGAREMLRGARAIVLLGRAWKGTYERLGVAGIVQCIPHGFFHTGDDIQLPPHFRDASAPLVVGSVTTWADMRYVGDAIALIDALGRSHLSSPPWFLGYLGGKFDARALEQLKEHKEKVMFLNSRDLHGVQSISEFRARLVELAQGRIVACVDELPGQMASFEAQLVDFNVQFYREPLNNDQAKVEYSGTAHMRANFINVVLQSPSMDDLVQDEGLQMVMVPMLQGNEIDFDAGAQSILSLILGDRQRLCKMVESNLCAAKLLSMQQIGKRWVQLLKSL